ncbi:DUF1795 domain-containing protein [Paraburkholderia sp. Ac-20340]|uniref:DcrB-related protein n=1 Tax=Paraburkholderia sp. Ac-20340 TaxID=2703888 RepID=UPI00197E49C6|nr:DUF1795 domain-containing protein [Paraburkholderia sp. Ac-20340]MBN3854777.1 DUF1795 domain-containing protein [Paraburkholderia sp. Ac-20340]
MHYAIHEGSFVLPDTALDRTVNILMLNEGPGGLNLVISRGRVREGENLDGFIAREWALATREAPQLTERSRTAVTVGGRAGVQIEATHEQEGRLRHQIQTVFPGDDSGRVLVMTLTSAAPFTDEQRAMSARMIDSYQPRVARPTLIESPDGAS